MTELVRKYGNKKWSLVGTHLDGRTGKQCRERWHNHLNPNIKKDAWSVEEDTVWTGMEWNGMARAASTTDRCADVM